MAASLCCEYLDTAKFQPPSVAAGLSAAVPVGKVATSNLLLMALSAPLPRLKAYGQLRMKTALPVCQTPRASSS